MKLKSNIVINAMEKRHISDIARIEEMCFSSPWSEDAIGEELNNLHAHYFVAECDGIVCGYVGIHTVLDEGYITNIAVDLNFRRQGIASKLLETLIAKMGELTFITLEVRVSNNPAIALYKSFGFEEVGVRKGYYTKPSEDALLMTKFREKQV